MANITASDVNNLRKQTGAGMMDCKNALVEADGDYEKAVEILRKKGQKVAAKRGDREANEGVVLAKSTGDKAAVIVLNCETDFVAKNEDFVKLAQTILDKAIENNPADLEALKALNFNGDMSIADKIIEQTGVIGEKLDLSTYEVVSGALAVAYNHPGNKLATIVAFNKAGDNIEEAGRQIAMQIAAMDPVAIDENGVAPEIIEREMAIGREQALQEGKPENIVDKIAEGKVKKFLKESTLLNQAFVRDNKITVAQFLKQTADGLEVTDFKRIMLG
ncbi:MAG: translation elongation factor Ts [Vicingaceae bacterium]